MTPSTELFVERCPPLPEERLTLPRSLFPDLEAAQRLAGRIYPDRVVYLSEGADDTWHADITSASHFAGRHDPELIDREEELRRAATWRREARIGQRVWLESYDHCWALSAWANTALPGDAPPLLVHIDAHTDLGTGLLLWGAEPGILCTATGDEASLHDPEAIDRIVLRGQVGLGAFLLPFLRAHPGTDVLHLAPETLCPLPEPVISQAVIPGPSLLGPSPPVLALGDSGKSPEAESAPFSWRRTPDAAEIARLPAGRPLLLDIDLDAFALLPSRTPPGRGLLDPTVAELKARVQEIACALRHSPALPWLAAVTVAYSPGFAPFLRRQEMLGLLHEMLLPSWEAAN